MQQVLSQGPLFIVCLIFLLGVVVIVHELGHYWALRKAGGAARSFSVGFGAPIVERIDKNGTVWKFSWIPFGGFVTPVRNDAHMQSLNEEGLNPIGKTMEELSVTARTIFALAGPFANFVLASLLFAMLLMISGRQPQRLTITGVEKGAAGFEAGLQEGDVIKYVAGKEIDSSYDLFTLIALHPNTPMNVTVERNSSEMDLVVTPDEVRRENEVGQYVHQAYVGIWFQRQAVGEPISYNPITAIAAGVVETGETMKNTAQMLHRIITQKMSVHSMTGPIGIGDASRRITNQVMARENVSFWNKIKDLMLIQLRFCALVSVGIGFFNLLPLPILDGGHVVMNGYEAVTGNPVPEKIQEHILTFGLFLLMGMFLIITWGDVLETGMFK